MIHVHRDDIDFHLMASVNEWFCLITVILRVYTDRADKKQ